jgi:hypothetical protein
MQASLDTFFLLVSRLAYFSILNVEAIFSRETSEEFCRTMDLYNPADSAVRFSLKSSSGTFK